MNMHSRFQGRWYMGKGKDLVGSLSREEFLPRNMDSPPRAEEPIYYFPFIEAYQMHSETLPQWGRPYSKSCWFFCLVRQGLPAQMYF